ncbi:MAG: alanine dehydrogenase [Williamsia sp.]|nr:alanine dehydrogenase [Williamsia sp.]
MKIGLIREDKVPADNRVALIPAQCRWIHRAMPHLKVVVQSAPGRCFTDREYRAAGVEVLEDMQECDLLLGIKEVPPEQLLPNKTYLFFSHTKKKQPHNQRLLQTVLQKGITLIDYECLEHEDGQRIIGFGFFAGLVGAHNGMMAYGNRSRLYQLNRVHESSDLRQLMHTYFGLRLPPVKIAVTGSGRVASGILEIMNLMGVIEVEPEEYLVREFSYAVYVHLKSTGLYKHKLTGKYNREEFHAAPADYGSLFQPYTQQTDILLNGVYWDRDIPRLFTWEDMADARFRIRVIADVTDDYNGSIPCNLGDGTLQEPVYGIDPITRTQTLPYQPAGVDLMAVSNLPNELPKDASRYFGEQLIKWVLPDLVSGSSAIIERATIARQGKLTPHFSYLQDYAAGR